MKEIKLTKNKFALVDDADYPFIARFKWYLAKDKYTNYARRNGFIGGQMRTMLMHQFIFGFSRMEIDHQDGNGLNNQRSNLRLASKNQNQRNSNGRRQRTSQYKGLHRISDGIKKWTASLTYNRKRIYIGSFLTEIEAAKAYDARAKELFGEFARLNFP